MSPGNTRITDAHFDYITKHTRAEDSLLQDLRAAAHEAGLPAISIGPAQGNLMQILLTLRGVHDVIEVGTLGGYSAITMARALPEGGTVRTIEINPHHAQFAREWVEKAGLSQRIQVLDGSGIDVLPTLDPRSADAAFLDADKANYPAYANHCLRLLRPRGLLMADNALAFGSLLDAANQDESVRAIRSFNEIVPTLPGLHSVLVPIGDGCWVGVLD